MGIKEKMERVTMLALIELYKELVETMDLYITELEAKLGGD